MQVIPLKQQFRHISLASRIYLVYSQTQELMQVIPLKQQLRHVTLASRIYLMKCKTPCQ